MPLWRVRSAGGRAGDAGDDDGDGGGTIPANPTPPANVGRDEISRKGNPSLRPYTGPLRDPIGVRGVPTPPTPKSLIFNLLRPFSSVLFVLHQNGPRGQESYSRDEMDVGEGVLDPG